MYVAEGKLELIKAELRSRGQELHKTTANDILMPLGIGIATLGVGAGMDGLLDHATGGAHLRQLAEISARAGELAPLRLADALPIKDVSTSHQSGEGSP